MLIASLMAFAGLLAAQGEALQLRVADEPELRAVYAQWDERRVPFVQRDDGWVTVIGIDLDTVPGEHAAELTREYSDGRNILERQVIQVEAESYPTTELTVAPGYVELSAEDQERAARESREISAIYSELTPEMLWTEPFDAPIPGAVDGRNFGHRRIFNGQARAPHSGADLRASTGTRISPRQ